MVYRPFTYSCLFILSLRRNSQALRLLYASQYLEADHCKESFSDFFFLFPVLETESGGKRFQMISYLFSFYLNLFYFNRVYFK